jgi:hypothetical protein
MGKLGARAGAGEATSCSSMPVPAIISSTPKSTAQGRGDLRREKHGQPRVRKNDRFVEPSVLAPVPDESETDLA